jgi:hypothetical protein
MGLLDHSTNNILIDAVLTDAGRKAIANSDDSFRITKYSFFDDEVDYTIIKKYGKTVGREKIEKNTPVFEASTSANTGLKHHLITLDSNSEYEPTSLITTPQDFFFLEVDDNGDSEINLLSGNSQEPETIKLTVKLKYKSGTILSQNYVGNFRIEYDCRFIQSVPTTNEEPIVGTFKKSLEKEGGGSAAANTASTIDFDITRSDLYSQYSASYSSNNFVTVPVKVIETKTGISTSITVKVTV